MFNVAQTFADAEEEAFLHSIRIQWWLLISSLLVLGGVLAVQSFMEYRDLTEREKQRLQNQARVIGLNIEHNLKSANLALSSLAKDAPAFIAQNNIDHLNHTLMALTDAMPGIRTLLVVDRNGMIIGSNRKEVVRLNVSNRDYFKNPLHQPDTDVLYVAPPNKSVLGVFVLNLSKIISAADGSFSGVVVAALDPEYFRILMDSVRFAPDMLSVIDHGDGTRFMMIPEQEEQAGRSVALPGTFYNLHRGTNKIESVFTGKSISYNSERMNAMRTVQPIDLRMDKPLYVACNREVHAVYADWYQKTLRLSCIFALICCSAIVSLRMLQARQRKLHLQVQQVRADQFRLSLRCQTMQSISQDGIHVLDIEGNLVESNATFKRMLGYSLDDEIRLNVKDWDTSIAENGQIPRIQDLIKHPSLFETKHRRSDGTFLDVEINACGVQLDGVWYLYASSRDITERKRIESELEAERQQLQNALDEVKTLRGIVPICANCKKVRDDQGYWSQVEQYVSAHTEAKFSHSLCPGCAHEFYPELYDELGRRRTMISRRADS